MEVSVTILLATFNGERYIRQQLESLETQVIGTINIVASDDGSTDSTMEILHEAQVGWTRGEFTIMQGPQKGFARNFGELIAKSPISSDYYAFCDQDDIWDNDKLKRAIDWMMTQDSTQPKVVGSRARLIDEAGRYQGLAYLPNKNPSFRNAIVQNITSGNTFVMDRLTMDMLKQTVKHIGVIPHDHWTYIIVTGAGGKFQYERQPAVSYRQHQTNVTGYRRSPYYFLWRFNRVRSLKAKQVAEIRIAAIEACSEWLTPSAKRTLENYKQVRTSDSVFVRLKMLHRSGIHRQSLKGQIVLYLDCFFRFL